MLGGEIEWCVAESRVASCDDLSLLGDELRSLDHAGDRAIEPVCIRTSERDDDVADREEHRFAWNVDGNQEWLRRRRAADEQSVRCDVGIVEEPQTHSTPYGHNTGATSYTTAGFESGVTVTR